MIPSCSPSLSGRHQEFLFHHAASTGHRDGVASTASSLLREQISETRRGLPAPECRDSASLVEIEQPPDLTVGGGFGGW
ncbi:hypothetical protein BC567DRAFT_215805 [Phyllosticta citribraziliensis]